MAAVTRPRIAATPRLPVRKSELAALRRSGTVPGSLYGRGADAVSLQVSARVLGTHLVQHGAGALMDLEFDGQVVPVVLNEVDRDGLTSAVIHVGFKRIVLGDQLHASIPLRFEGLDEILLEGLVLQKLLDTVEVHGQADRLPETLTVHVGKLRAGESVHLDAIVLPEGVHLTRDGSTAAAIVTSPRRAEVVVAKDGAAAA